VHPPTSAEDAARDLACHLEPEQILLPGSPGYDAVHVWNAAIGNRAALVVRPRTPAEVQAAVRAAADHELPLSVLGGGHDWAGRALRPDGLVIDMSAMRQVTVDERGRTATLGGGATSADVIAAATPHGLVAATGVVGGVGMAGLTMGGGYGPISGLAGLALDNLLGADVVLADGRLVTADETHEPELFWALRGGGGNFGVVVSLRIRLHALENPLVGVFLFPLDEADAVLRTLAEILRTAPDELTVQSGILPANQAGPALIVSPVWCGEGEAGTKIFEQIRGAGASVHAEIRRMPYAELLTLYDAGILPGRGYAIKTRTVPALLPEVIATLVAAGQDRTSPASAVFIHHFHGAPARVTLDATAFGIRRDHLVIEVIAAWDEPDEHPARHRVWAAELSTALAAHSLPGGYANLLGADEHAQIAEAYGPNADRLLATARRYDPAGVFTAIALPDRPIADEQKIRQRDRATV
jgi:FAD/FMN-containing dehydrogenase